MTERRLDVLIQGRNQTRQAFQQASRDANKFSGEINSLATRFVGVSAIAMAAQRATRAWADELERAAEAGEFDQLPENLARSTQEMLKQLPVVGRIGHMIALMNRGYREQLQHERAMSELVERRQQLMREGPLFIDSEIQTGAAEAEMGRLNKRMEELEERANRIRGSLSAGLFETITDDLGGRISAEVAARRGTLDEIDRELEQVRSRRRMIHRQLEETRELQEQRRSSQEAANAEAQRVEKAQEAIDSLTNSYRDQIVTLRGGPDALEELRIARLAEAGASREAANAAREHLNELRRLQEQEQLQTSVDGLTDALRRQVETFGKSRDELMQWRIAQLEARGASAEAARQYLRQLRELNAEEARREAAAQRQQDAQRLLDRILDRSRTPLERYQDELKRLTDFHNEGKISAEEHAKAVAAVNQQIEQLGRTERDAGRRQLQAVEGRLLVSGPGREQQRDPTEDVVRETRAMAQVMRQLMQAIGRGNMNRTLERLLDQGVVLQQPGGSPGAN